MVAGPATAAVHQISYHEIFVNGQRVAHYLTSLPADTAKQAATDFYAFSYQTPKQSLSRRQQRREVLLAMLQNHGRMHISNISRVSNHRLVHEKVVVSYRAWVQLPLQRLSGEKWRLMYAVPFHHSIGNRIWQQGREQWRRFWLPAAQRLDFLGYTPKALRPPAADPSPGPTPLRLR